MKFALLVTSLLSVSAIAHDSAQTPRFHEPLLWAMPVAQRPDSLKSAQDMVTVEGQGIRLRAEVWLRVEPCAVGKSRAPCPKPVGTEGRMFLGPIWEETRLSQYEVEQVWLLSKDQVWTTESVHKNASGQFEFSGGPVWPNMAPVDVVVKLRNVPQLLQV